MKSLKAGKQKILSAELIYGPFGSNGRFKEECDIESKKTKKHDKSQTGK